MKNIYSVTGLIFVLFSTLSITLFFILESFAGVKNVWLELTTYLILPALLILGLLLIPFGIWKRRRKVYFEAEGVYPALPKIDLAEPHTIKLLAIITLCSTVFATVVAVSTVKGFEFTESPSFCGQLCHTVMEPEFTAWKSSPHSRVRCVDCHVGPGAEWYVKAKISGLRQIWVVLTHSWPTPIATPIENLRPARGTCEQCHWPEKFYAGRQKIFYHYAADEKNTPREVDMLIKIGGTPKKPNAMGIHWHIGREVYFLATDQQRLEIPYIAVKGADGKITEYFSTEKPPSAEALAKGKKRVLDCTDCHNKPTHIYYSPGEEMDHNFVSGTIDRSIPYIKKVAVELLEKRYNSREEAHKGLENGIRDYYSKHYPELVKLKGEKLEQAITQIKAIYSRNYFPKMKVSWNSYPNHLGHFYGPGCFRCHDGRHQSKDGRVISRDCTLCHDILRQVQENIKAGDRPGYFVHPVDIGDDLYTTNCHECHSAGGLDVAGGNH